mmetsp:Transcript_10217/g.20359  ORF Transcript_10217/g.20359 Transcript_10217/m.20359 type:complete len:240 (+) Transcript_10217:343-1062(+)
MHFRINLKHLLKERVKDAKDNGSLNLVCGCGRCQNPLPVTFSVERFERGGVPEPLYDTEKAALAGRLGLVRPECNGRTNINSVPVDRPKHIGFITDTVGRAVSLVQDRLEVVDRARAEQEDGLPGDRFTANRRTARDEDIVHELEEHVKKGTLREHIRSQIEEKLKDDYPDWEDDSMYYPCPHCVGKGLSEEEEALDFGSPSARLKRTLHTSNNPRQASPLLVPLFDRLHLTTTTQPAG